MSIRISQLKKRVGDAVKFSTSVGVAATVAASTLIASAVETIDVTTASGLVETHARRTNTEANLAAKILDIDRSSLVNKNYLRLASRIDDYLTGKTDELVVDSSMFGTSVAAEQVSISDDVHRAISEISKQFESEPSDAITDTETSEITDDSSDVSDITKEVSSIVTQSQVAGVSSVQITAPPSTSSEEDRKESIISQDSATDVDHHKTDNDESSKTTSLVSNDSSSDDSSSDQAIEDVKVVDEIKSVKSSAVDTTDDVSKIEDLKVASKITDVTKLSSIKSPIANQGAIEALKNAVHSQGADAKSEDSDAVAIIDETKNDQFISETSEDVTVDGIETVEDVIAPISDLPESEESKVDSSETSEPSFSVSESDTSSETESNISAVSERDSEEIFGTFTIHIVRRYNNNRYIDEFDLVKQSKGIRHADGSEEWESIKFDASDLSESQKTASSNGNDYSLMNPEFEVFYTPKSGNDRIDDRLTLSKIAKSEVVEEIEPSNDQIVEDNASEDLSIPDDSVESNSPELEIVDTDEDVLAKSDQSVESDQPVDSVKSIDADVSEETDSYHVADQILSRKIILKKEDGSVIQEIQQTSEDDEVQISQIIDDLFTDMKDLSIKFDNEDLEVVYKPIYSEVAKIENYLVRNVDEMGAEIGSYSAPVRIDGVVNNLDKTSHYDVRSLENSSELSHSSLEDYDFSDTTYDHASKIVTHRYTSKQKEVEEKIDTTQISKEEVRSVALSMLESMPTLSNRVEYSKFTTIEESYSRILQKDAIESLVFDVSNGSYDYLASDKVLQPSQESVLVSEMNSRFTDRLVYRVNEFRRSLGLQEVSKVSMSQEMDRMFASATIYNYLYNNHSNSKVGRNFEKIVGLERIETMQPVHTLTTSKIGLTPEAAADSLFRTILSEVNSYVLNDGGETGHLEQLLDFDQKQIYAGMFIGEYDVSDQYVGLFGKQIKSGTKYSYKISTTLHYFK